MDSQEKPHSDTPAAPVGVSRRSFLQQAGGFATSAWLASIWPVVLSTAAHARDARQRGAPFKVLTEEEVALLDAIATQIIPSGDGLPGAREADVVRFMDRALETFMAEGLEPLRAGLADFDRAVRSADAEGRAFAALPHDSRTNMMQLLVEEAIFGIVRFLTLAGMFALPSYGGNKDKAGWKLIGFEDRHAWQPPFGYYDNPEGDYQEGASPEGNEQEGASPEGDKQDGANQEGDEQEGEN